MTETELGIFYDGCDDYEILDRETLGRNLSELHNELRSGALCFVTAWHDTNDVLARYGLAFVGVPDNRIADAVTEINRENNRRLFKDLRRYFKYTSLYKVGGVFLDTTVRIGDREWPEREEAFAVRFMNCGNRPDWVDDRAHRLQEETSKYYDTDHVLVIYGKGNRDGHLLGSDDRYLFYKDRRTREDFGFRSDYDSVTSPEDFLRECESMGYNFKYCGGKRDFHLEFVGNRICSPVRIGQDRPLGRLTLSAADELLRHYKPENFVSRFCKRELDRVWKTLERVRAREWKDFKRGIEEWAEVTEKTATTERKDEI